MTIMCVLNIRKFQMTMGIDEAGEEDVVGKAANFMVGKFLDDVLLGP